MKRTQPWRLALILVPLLALALRLWGLNAAGETWDEIAYYDAAKHYSANVVNGIWEADAWNANREHPPVAKWLYGLVSLRSFQANEVDFKPGRLLSALMGSATILLTILIGWRLYSPKVGVLAGIILACSPLFIALNRVLGLDTPTTLFFTLTVYCFLEALFRPQQNSRWYAAATLALGLALGTRLSNLLLYPLLAMLAIIVLRSDWKRGRRLPELGWLAPLILFPPLIVWASWPWLWEDFRAHLNITFGHWSAVETIFLGVRQLPGASYYLIYYLVTLPALVVILSLYFFARTLLRGRRSDWILFVWIVAVFLFSFYALRQGGIRYLLQLFPAVSIAVASVVGRLMDGLKNQRLAWLLPAIFVSYLALQAGWYQPYQLDYYNEFTGGAGQMAAQKLFQIGWWNEGVEEAVLWLNKNGLADRTVTFAAIPDRSARLLRTDFKRIEPANGDYIVINRARQELIAEYPEQDRYQPIYTVAVRGAILAEVWERR
ncbi:glycosyltransferase family 39 protein [Candidatus Berkelbacteria bacterium]|nr:glycosyltransferase family 39 protein [Candidatus Berkelbacteria bacterium]